MELLIDTQAILWFQSSDDRLSNNAKNLILDNKNVCFVSIASLWEIAIKINLNKLNIGMDFRELQDYLSNFDFKILDLKFTHLVNLATLNNYHKDPFDRILIAQAISEGLTIVSIDSYFKSYSVNILW